MQKIAFKAESSGPQFPGYNLLCKRVIVDISWCRDGGDVSGGRSAACDVRQKKGLRGWGLALKTSLLVTGLLLAPSKVAFSQVSTQICFKSPNIAYSAFLEISDVGIW